MRVCHLVASTDRRGAEVFAGQLSDELGERGHDSTVVPIAGAGGATGYRRRFGRSLRRRIGQAADGADVVVAHGSTTLLSTTLALRHRSVPVVYRSIGDPDHWAPKVGRQGRVGRPLRACTAVVALWPGAAAAMERHYGLDPERLVVIPTGVAPESFVPAAEGEGAEIRRRLGLPTDRPVAAYVGALAREKRPDLAVEAARRADMHLVIAGDGPLRGRLEGQAGSRVTFLGVTEEPAEVLRAADVVLLTSATEGIPAALIEAGLCGVASVATDVGGVAHVIIDGQTGTLVPSADPDDLAAALRATLDEPGYGPAARIHCLERFSLPVVADQWEALLSSLVPS